MRKHLPVFTFVVGMIAAYLSGVALGASFSDVDPSTDLTNEDKQAVHASANDNEFEIGEIRHRDSDLHVPGSARALLFWIIDHEQDEKDRLTLQTEVGLPDISSWWVLRDIRREADLVAIGLVEGAEYTITTNEWVVSSLGQWSISVPESVGGIMVGYRAPTQRVDEDGEIVVLRHSDREVRTFTSERGTFDGHTTSRVSSRITFIAGATSETISLDPKTSDVLVWPVLETFDPTDEFLLHSEVQLGTDAIRHQMLVTISP